MNSSRHSFHRRSVFLIGMMGCGKSSVGRRLARRLRVMFRDLDTEIEERAGMPITEIFQTQGEEYFRALELENLQQALTGNAVIATGGGVVVTPENRQLLVRAAAGGANIVYLHADPLTLARRAGLSPGSRPLLLTEAGAFDFRQAVEKLEELLAVRDPLYRECATLVVDVANRRPDVIEAEIARHLTGNFPI